MFDERLPTKVWVDALVRRVQVAGASAFVIQSGDVSRGDILIKVADLSGGGRVYAPRTNMDGERVFVDLAVQGVGPDEQTANDYIYKARERDRDLWIVEIEDRDGRHFLTEPIETAL
ncbi:MAG: DUF1491 family protein [Henriciella sp.]|nr:DUF1491 family protein [Henriciella sp.]